MNTDSPLDEIVAEIATKGMIGMQLAMADESSKHHKKVLEEAKKLIELYCHKQVIEELSHIPNSNMNYGYIQDRIAELRKTL